MRLCAASVVALERGARRWHTSMPSVWAAPGEQDVEHDAGGPDVRQPPVVAELRGEHLRRTEPRGNQGLS